MGTAACFWERRISSSRMALMSEAEEWLGGEFSSGGAEGYPIPGVSRWAGGAEGSLSAVRGIWNREGAELSGEHSTVSLTGADLLYSSSAR